ncbi:hypothetical protein F4805DRAFT_427426 [Annulohypoxylon moriforme]|nr:hypothetical protein F4805DRAFT_427426 [Annulohypoxylon moriforme]
MYSEVVGSVADIISNAVDVYRKAALDKAMQPTTTKRVTPKSIGFSSDCSSKLSLMTKQGRASDEKNIKDRSRSCLAIGSRMALGATAGVGNIVSNTFKIHFIDIPLALAEGIHNLPRLYDGQV